MRGFLASCGLAAGLVACGGEGQILLELSASRLSVPADLDRVVVRSRGVGEAALRLDVTLDLSSAPEFPIDVLLTPSSDTPKVLLHEIDCFLNETPVCSLAATHAWNSDSVNRVRITLDEP